VSRDDPECTYSFYQQNLFNKVSLTPENIYPTRSDLSVDEAARLYAESMRGVFGDVIIPRFDLLLLGMGPDGHTCSLFPGHPVLNVDSSQWVAAVHDSPKPPPQRVTMTMSLLLNARSAVFVACGVSKADIVQKVLETTSGPLLPAAMVRPHDGIVHWFLDISASSKLTSL